MAVEFSGEYRIPAPQQRVWAALNNPAVLQASIAGCQQRANGVGLLQLTGRAGAGLAGAVRYRSGFCPGLLRGAAALNFSLLSVAEFMTSLTSIFTTRHRHCEKQSDAAIHGDQAKSMDCFAALAMTRGTVAMTRGSLAMTREAVAELSAPPA